MTSFAKREQIDPALCWDVSAIFKDQAAADAAGQALAKQLADFCQEYEGKIQKLNSPGQIIKLIKDYESLVVDLIRYSNYHHLSYAVEMTNPELRSAFGQASMKLNQFRAKLAFFNSEISRVPAELLKSSQAEAPEYASFIQDIIDWLPHQLSPETEGALAILQPSLNAGYELYETLKFNDLKFPNFKLGDREYPLSYVLYENNYSASENTELRRESFKQFSRALENYLESTAAVYNLQVQSEKQQASIRGFDSVFDYLLHEQKVTREMYDRQIDTIMRELSGPMRRYAQLLQRVHGLDKLYFSDLKLPLDPSYTSKVSPEDAKEICAEVLGLMGQDYKDMLMPAFSQGWLDFAQNEGKSTGGFATYVPGAHPYILLNWDDSMSEVFTLIHELGHAGQFLCTAEAQAQLQSGMSMYSVEAPSTFHELLLGYHLLQKPESDPRFKRWVASLMVGNTYYHNMVTHLHEAAYQREIYRLVDQGQVIDGSKCRQIFKQVLQDFWGDTVILDEGCDLTWMRQPHYYMGLYSFTYSAGLTIGTEMFQRLREKGPEVLADWHKFISAGSSLKPLDQAALAGIDISTDQPLKRTIAYIDELIRTCEQMTDQLEAGAGH